MNSYNHDERPGAKAAQGAKRGSVSIKLRPKTRPSADHLAPGTCPSSLHSAQVMSNSDPNNGGMLLHTSQAHTLLQPGTQHDPPLPNTSCSILTLPTEITAEIFARCLPEVASTPRIDTAPLLLGRICSNWRSISLDTPELWSSLKVAVSDTPVDSVEKWLTRARHCPLSLVVDCFQSDGRFIDVLQRHSYTWHDVELGLPFEQFYRFEPDLRLPMLEGLAIAAVNYHPPVEHPVNAFRNAPALRHLRLLTSVLPAHLALPWTQLTSFESDALSPDECLNVLKYTPNIVECVFGIYFTAPDALPDVPPCMFLTTLRISSHLRNVMDLLGHISAPALQVLDLKRILIRADYYFPPLHRFLSRSGCLLRELSIWIHESDESLVEEVPELLETQSALEKLELRNASLGVLTAICRRMSDGSLFLPRISDFHASAHIIATPQIHHAFSGMLDALVDSLFSRLAAPRELVTPIQNCSITYSRAVRGNLDHVIAAFQPRLEELTTQGVHIHVGTQR